jgi:hypothetical protein
MNNSGIFKFLGIMQNANIFLGKVQNILLYVILH